MRRKLLLVPSPLFSNVFQVRNHMIKIPCCKHQSFKNNYSIGFPTSSGKTIRAELTSMSIALELPKDHAIRKTVAQYKQRYEEYSDEHLG